MKILLLPNPIKQDVLEVTQQAVSILSEAGAEILMESDCQKYGLQNIHFCSPELALVKTRRLFGSAARSRLNQVRERKRGGRSTE